jgi:hypothetical protein
VEILGGVWIYTQQVDEDGERMIYGLTVSKARILVQITDDWFQAIEFAPNAEINYQIYASQGRTSLLKGTMQSDGNGFVQTWVGDQVNLVPGNYFIVTDGSLTKEIFLVDLKFDKFDLSDGQVQGSAPPPGGRQVWVGYGTVNNWWTLNLNTNTGNTWSGNFSAPVPMNYQWAATQIFEDDGDASGVRPTLVLGDVTIDVRP